MNAGYHSSYKKGKWAILLSFVGQFSGKSTMKQIWRDTTILLDSLTPSYSSLWIYLLNAWINFSFTLTKIITRVISVVYSSLWFEMTGPFTYKPTSVLFKFNLFGYPKVNQSLKVEKFRRNEIMWKWPSISHLYFNDCVLLGW